MQVRWNKKLPKHYLHSVSQSVSSHQGGRSFARVTRLSVQPSKSKNRRSFPMAFFNPQPWTEQMPPGGYQRKESTVQGTSTAGHRCCWSASCSKAPLSSLFFSVCTVQTHFNFMTFTCRIMQVQQRSRLFFSAGFDLSCLGARAPKIGKDVRKLEESVNLRCRHHNSWLRPWFERLPAVHWPNVG